MGVHEPASESTRILDLTGKCLEVIFQHVVADPETTTSTTAAISLTCKHFYMHNDEMLNCYMKRTNPPVVLAQCPEAADSLCQWLSKRQRGRVPAVTVLIKAFAAYVPRRQTEEWGRWYRQDLLGWKAALGMLSMVPGLHLRVEMPCFAESLKHLMLEHGNLVDELLIERGTAGLSDEKEGRLPLADILQTIPLTNLTSLIMKDYSSSPKQIPWSSLAALTGLRHLNCCFREAGHGDPSPLSALTGLTSLRLASMGSRNPFTVSSLQPLSTLQQLEVLKLEHDTCTATSLQGLAGLSRLREVSLASGRNLVSLVGLGTGVTSLQLHQASSFQCLAGIEAAASLQSLHLGSCRVSCLLPLSSLSSLRVVDISGSFSSLAGLESSRIQYNTIQYNTIQYKLGD